ncbi:esterase E4-like [Condylostylus longicornis]|uniref:esterase E4-like n=1 Tax=Condylostylus longicornis TaxID=2530218 RepID=UPI00244D9CCF|nr:esterase E4-like [Condylostylus longicornis]
MSTKIEKNGEIINSNLQILGRILKSNNGHDIYSFRGIPYAKPPVGRKRFKDPEPYGKWNNLLDARRDGHICPQPIKNLNEIKDLTISEDCLTLNVYTKSMDGNSSVLVFIHGGGYKYGSGNSFSYKPKYLLDNDIVLVTFNYRLGPLGFISSGSKHATGNYGFKDQVLVLKWIQNNIHYFGGNPNSVTLIGHSAGAMSATLHLVSPMSKNLFHRIVALSGSTTSQWPTNNVNLTKILAKSVECPIDHNDEMIKCLRKKPWEKLIEIGAKWDGNCFPDLEWNYEIEKNFGQEKFMINHPVILFKIGEFHKVPIIIGITKDEYKDQGYILSNNTELLNDISENFNNIAPKLFGYGNSNQSDYISNRFKQSYFNNEKINIESKTKLGDLFSDAVINFSVHRLVHLASQYINIYYYRFDYKGNYSCATKDNNGKPYFVHHDDTLIYLFNFNDCAPVFQNRNDSDYNMMKKLNKYLINFARFGNPNMKKNNKREIICETYWTPTTKRNIKTFYINEACETSDPPNEDRLVVWDELFPINE